MAWTPALNLLSDLNTCPLVRDLPTVFTIQRKKFTDIDTDMTKNNSIALVVHIRRKKLRGHVPNDAFTGIMDQ